MGDFDDLLKDFGAFAEDTPVLDDLVYYTKIKNLFVQYFQLKDATPVAPYTWVLTNTEKRLISIFSIGNSFDQKFEETYQSRGIDGLIKVDSVTLKQEAHLNVRINESESYLIPFHVIGLSYTELPQRKTPDSPSLGQRIETNFINHHPSLDLKSREELIATRLNSFSEKSTDAHLQLEHLWRNHIKKSKLLGAAISFQYKSQEGER